MMLLAPVIGGSAAVVGLYLSWSYDTPVGGTIVLIATAVFLAAWLLAPRHGLLTKRWRRVSGKDLAGSARPSSLSNPSSRQEPSPASR